MSNFKEQKTRQRNMARLRDWLRSLLSKQPTVFPPTEIQETKAFPDLEQSTLCTSLDRLLFTDFLKCVCDGDYSPLVLSGEPTVEDIMTAWASIVSECHAITESKEASKHISLSAKLERLSTKINIITQLVDAARVACAPELLAELKDWGYRYPFTEQSLQADLERILASLGNDKTKLAQAVKEYEAEQEKQREQPENARQMYLETLYAIEESRKMEFNLDTLTAGKFAVMYISLKKRNQLIKNKYNGHGSK